jgi:HEAT repeat protein
MHIVGASWRRWALAVSLVTSSGCMTTVLQTSYWRDEPQLSETNYHLYVFGGTAFDAIAFVGGASSRGEGGIAAILIFDLPFSLAADVVLLPLCIYQQFDRSTWTEERYLPLLADPDPARRIKAVTALGGLEGATPHRIETLARLLDDPDAKMRTTALRSLDRLGHASAPAAPRIAQLLKDPDENLRVSAARVIVAVGADPEFAASALVAAMHDASAYVRAAAVTSLGEIAGDAKGALPAIREALHDPSETVRDAADRALSASEARAAPRS